VRAGERLERERLGRDEVAHADLDRIDAELVGRDVEDALEHLGRFGPARTPVRGGAVVFVAALQALSSTFGIAYTPWAIVRVRNGRNAPIDG